MAQIILRTAEDCEAAAKRSIFEQTAVALNVGIASIEAKQIEARLNQLHAKCGCHESGFTLLLLFGVSLTAIWTNRSSGSSFAATFGLSILAFFVSAFVAGIAKFVAISYYRRSYRRQLFDLAAELRNMQNSYTSNIG